MYFEQGAGTAQDAADAVHAFWNGIAGVVHQTYHFQVEPLVYDIDPITEKAVGTTTTSTTGFVGTRFTEPLPPSNQGLIRWHTGVFTGGRELIGKTYIPGACEDFSDSGVPSASYLTNLSTNAANLGSGGPPAFVIWSRKHHVTGAAGLGSPWSQWAVLRSRRS